MTRINFGGRRAGKQVQTALAVQKHIDAGMSVYLATAERGLERVVGTVPCPNTRLIEGSKDETAEA